MRVAPEMCGWIFVNFAFCWAAEGDVIMEGIRADILAEAKCI